MVEGDIRILPLFFADDYALFASSNRDIPIMLGRFPAEWEGTRMKIRTAELGAKVAEVAEFSLPVNLGSKPHS